MGRSRLKGECKLIAFSPCQTNPSKINNEQTRFLIIKGKAAYLTWQFKPLVSNQRVDGSRNVSLRPPRPNFPNMAFLLKTCGH
jgi:hypothetical protein